MLFAAVHESGNGTTRTFRNVRYLVAMGWKADIDHQPRLVGQSRSGFGPGFGSLATMFSTR
jgi:hypothetical protein